MIRVGVVGEDPNDTQAIRNLLSRYYPNLQMIPLIKRIRGWQLQRNNKVKRLLAVEFTEKKVLWVLFVIDLDGRSSDSNKIKDKYKWFADLNSATNGKGMLLLNIEEIEALILSDIETFHKIYKTSFPFSSNPMQIIDPKEFLKEKTIKSKKQYCESDCPEIFSRLDIKHLTARCKYFAKFVSDFETKIA